DQFAQAIADLAKKNGFRIDPSRVAVVGWSGAGTDKNTGLARLAKLGGKVTINGVTKPLAVLGCADTGVGPAGAMGKVYEDALTAAGNTPTVEYTVQLPA